MRRTSLLAMTVAVAALLALAACSARNGSTPDPSAGGSDRGGNDSGMGM